MSTAARELVSETEFLSLPESNQRVELLDGEVIVAPSPSYRHQELLTRIVGALRSWADTHGVDVTVAQAPLDVRFAPGRILQPDAMVFRGALPDDIETPVDRIPELCIEVLSHNCAYDRVTKRYLYAEAGVQEYWLVDLSGVIERRSGPDLSEVELLDNGLTSSLLPGFLLTFDRLFARR